jgi:hypothetical protein
MRTPRTPRRGDKPRRHARSRRLALALAAAAALLLFALISGYRDTASLPAGGGVVARRALRPVAGGGAPVEGEYGPALLFG